jgi:hypothetical protein
MRKLVLMTVIILLAGCIPDVDPNIGGIDSDRDFTERLRYFEEVPTVELCRMAVVIEEATSETPFLIYLGTPLVSFREGQLEVTNSNRNIAMRQLEKRFRDVRLENCAAKTAPLEAAASSRIESLEVEIALLEAERQAVEEKYLVTVEAREECLETYASDASSLSQYIQCLDEASQGYNITDYSNDVINLNNRIRDLKFDLSHASSFKGCEAILSNTWSLVPPEYKIEENDVCTGLYDGKSFVDAMIDANAEYKKVKAAAIEWSSLGGGSIISCTSNTYFNTTYTNCR